MRDLELALSNFPTVNFWYIVYPEEPLSDDWVPISFKNTANFIDKGIKDGYKAVEAYWNSKDSFKMFAQKQKNMERIVFYSS